MSNLKEAMLDLRFTYRYEKDKLIERFWMWLAWKLPRPLVLWAAARLMSSATVGEYSNTVVPELTCIDALNRWK